ncbi:hypothetical protein D1007_05409 [Hordeum vulgare]|nr:hypothetical protein D1007_05409 [Hordeum vulgare]
MRLGYDGFLVNVGKMSRLTPGVGLNGVGRIRLHLLRFSMPAPSLRCFGVKDGDLLRRALGSRLPGPLGLFFFVAGHAAAAASSGFVGSPSMEKGGEGRAESGTVVSQTGGLRKDKVIDLALELINPVIEPGEVLPNVNCIHLVIDGELRNHHVVGVESTLATATKDLPMAPETC